METPDKRRVAKSSLFVLLYTVIEKYATNGISAVLLLFINLKLGYDRDDSTAIFHTIGFLYNVFAIFGAIIADSLFGICKTMVSLTLILSAGSFIIAVGAIDALHLPITVFSAIGLVLITAGDGCLRPLGYTYGAQQYQSYEVKSIALYFALYYSMINIGNIIGGFVSPILRQDVKCFGNDDCFALAFGIPGIFIVLSTIFLMLANIYSETVRASGTTILNVLACIWHAIVTKMKSRKFTNLPKKHHWLDYSEEKYGKMLVLETRVILNVVVIFLPTPIFWALYHQQNSRWVFQAMRMNGDLGFYTIIPDQFNFIGPVIVLILIPVFDYVIYPLLAKIGIRTALQKATLGGVLAGVAFLISATVESQIDGKYLHMAWLLPQYLVISLAEILSTIPLMNFSYSEAPKSMKSILQALRMLCIGLGNLIVVIVAGSKMIESQIYEDILFAGLMFVDMIIFAFLAYRYKRLDLNGEKRVANENDESNKTI